MISLAYSSGITLINELKKSFHGEVRQITPSFFVDQPAECGFNLFISEFVDLALRLNY
jgi:hypothetical protein